MRAHGASADARRQKAVKHFKNGRLNEAQRLFTQILRDEPEDADVWLLLGVTRGRLGAPGDAAKCFSRALQLRPRSFEAALNLAQALELQGQLQDAADTYKHAIQINLNSTQACRALARLLLRIGPLDETIVVLQRAIHLEPENIDNYLDLGSALQAFGHTSDALAVYERALQLDPQRAATYAGRAAVLSNEWRLDEALADARKAQALDPENVAHIALEARILERQGEKAQAIERLRPILEKHSDYPQVALAHARLCNQLNSCNEAIEGLKKMLRDPELRMPMREAGHYELGRLYDRKGSWDRAFAHYKTVNTLQHVPFDRAAHGRFIDRLIETFDAEFLARMPRADVVSDRPLFIVGMPRSGTTLTEQILSSHRDVAAGGELNYVSRIATELGVSEGHAAHPWRELELLTAEKCSILARSYLAELAKISSEARHVTDKMPQNFLYLGLIALLFPGARVVHCIRNPMDTCLSCYFQNFPEGHNYSRDLSDLGFYYRSYKRLMAHWRRVLNVPVLDVAYEDVVADLEGNARRLIEFVGLPWDPQCLEFAESRREAKTASYDQVRQPIYTRSVERWRHYEAHLEPLKRELEGD